jgi:hypothetical protein
LDNNITITPQRRIDMTVVQHSIGLVPGQLFEVALTPELVGFLETQPQLNLQPVNPPMTGTSLPAGGSTGQVATKRSNADFDIDWQTPSGGGVGGVSDGDKGDIVVSGGGTVWSLDAGVLAAHRLETNPHPGYLTPAEGNAAYDPLGAAAAVTKASLGITGLPG